MIRVREATCFADCATWLSGHCLDVSGTYARAIAWTFTGCFAGCFSGRSANGCPDIARTLSRLALDNRRPVLRTRRGLCADTLLARTERGPGWFATPDRSRPCPGDCRIKDTDKPRSRTYAGRFAWTFRVQPRLIRGHKGLSGLRGWCLNKMNGFPIPESRQRFRSVERHRIDELMCK